MVAWWSYVPSWERADRAIEGGPLTGNWDGVEGVNEVAHEEGRGCRCHNDSAGGATVMENGRGELWRRDGVEGVGDEMRLVDSPSDQIGAEMK